MGFCPKCKRNSVFYDPSLKEARCYYKSCGFEEKVPDEKRYIEAFEKTSDDYARKVPSYDLSFTVLRQAAFAIKLRRHIKGTSPFYFFSSVDKYTGESVESLDEFSEKLKTVDIKSLEFHFYRGDFERWILQAFGEGELTRDIINLREKNPMGEALRNQLYNIARKYVRGASAEISI